ncbi:acireductone synthase [Insolitispirillum peregrinum]|uniref:Enolase-phosphatase E1 n=1 Tax=Insolitispirillum peregrinum TaxID=80876 RepID=A0A1N7LXV2_9PROT|nr:acireductone synthase [Insolitispirillum peregrinum]SIS78675.1 acireductone synthase [Insolitispirillum peregrinum]
MTTGSLHVVLTDIEGTTSSITFVRDVLFPYAKQRMAAFLHAHQAEPVVSGLIAEVRQIAELPASSGPDALAAVLNQWADDDRKVPPLKALQGLIWRDGYESGALKADIYPDALAALRAWDAAGVPIYVYSSGSVEAQHLFFGHTVEGDLRGLFQDHFDTLTGAKTDPGSYQTICAITGYQPDEVLFLTDNPAEVAAAHHAGVQVVAVQRDGGAPLAVPVGVPVVSSFADIPAAMQPTP